MPARAGLGKPSGAAGALSEGVDDGRHQRDWKEYRDPETPEDGRERESLLPERVSGRFVWPEGVAAGLEVPVVSVLLAHARSMPARAVGASRQRGGKRQANKRHAQRVARNTS